MKLRKPNCYQNFHFILHLSSKNKSENLEFAKSGFSFGDFLRFYADINSLRLFGYLQKSTHFVLVQMIFMQKSKRKQHVLS